MMAMHRAAILAVAAVVSVVAAVVSLDQPAAPAQTLHRGINTTVNLSSLATRDTRAVVLYFIASDCPVSNRTLPEMLRVEHEFATHRVTFVFVYPNSTETPETIRAHRAAYSLTETFLTDPRDTYARLAAANTTPEAAILVPVGKTLKPVYTGRIDDRYLSLGTERPAATHHDLEAALTAVLTHQPIPPPGGPPVGCAFMTLPNQ